MYILLVSSFHLETTQFRSKKQGMEKNPLKYKLYILASRDFSLSKYLCSFSSISLDLSHSFEFFHIVKKHKIQPSKVEDLIGSIKP